MGRSVAAAIAAVLVLGACTNDPPADGFEGLPTESPTAPPSPTASAEAVGEIDVTTTPDEITPEWVTAVVNTLLAEYGEMTAEILAMPVSDDPTLPEGFEDQLDDLFDGEYLERRRLALQNALTNEGDLRDQLLPADEFGGLRFTADIVQYAENECIIAVGTISRQLTTPDGGPTDGLSAVSLQRVPGGNATQWVIMDELANVDPDGEPNPDEVMLDATLADYEGALDNECSGES